MKGLISGGDNSPCLSSHPSRVGPMRCPPSTLAYLQLSSLFRSCLGISVVLRFRGYGFPVIYRRHYLVADVLVLWLLNLSTLSSTVLPEPKCRSCVDSLSMEHGHSTVIILWVLISCRSLSAAEELFSEGWDLHLSVGRTLSI